MSHRQELIKFESDLRRALRRVFWILVLFGIIGIAMLFAEPPMPTVAVVPTNVPVTFRFTYPTNEIGQATFIAYSTPSVVLPLTQWRIVTNISGAAVTVIAAKTQSANLSWDLESDLNVAGYIAYWGTAQGQYNSSKDVGNVSTTTISGMNPGQTYYFVVTAYSASRLESPPSNEAGYTTMAAPGRNAHFTALAPATDHFFTLCASNSHGIMFAQ